MSKKCLKCGYIRQASDLTCAEECPQCGAIYTKVNAAMKNNQNPKSNKMNFPTNQHNFSNYEKYDKYTREKNWRKICEVNGINLDSFGTKKELKVLSDYLENDEIVFALTSGVMKQTSTSNSFDFGVNTWLVALTNERFLFLDHAMMTKSVDTQSIRHNSVQAVSASQGLVLGKIQVDLGARVVVIDNCQKATVKVVADLANKWLKVLEKQTNVPIDSSAKDSISEMQEIAKLSRIQIKNQERIILLLEEMKKNDVSFYGRVTRKK